MLRVDLADHVAALQSYIARHMKGVGVSENDLFARLGCGAGQTAVRSRVDYAAFKVFLQLLHDQDPGNPVMGFTADMNFEYGLVIGSCDRPQNNVVHSTYRSRR